MRGSQAACRGYQDGHITKFRRCPVDFHRKKKATFVGWFTLKESEPFPKKVETRARHCATGKLGNWENRFQVLKGPQRAPVFVGFPFKGTQEGRRKKETKDLHDKARAAA